MPGAVDTSTNPYESSEAAPNSVYSGKTTGPFITITLLFFFWGFITVMNDVLIPFLKGSFELSFFQAALVQGAFFGAFFVISAIYFGISSSSGDPINRFGYQKTIVLALIVCAAGCALFSPAAGFAYYPFFLGALFLLATGVTILQIAANPYAAILGKPENASARLNLAQGFNSLGTTLAPIVGGLLLYKVFASEGEVTLQSIETPYLIYGGMFLALAVLVGLSKLPSIAGGNKIEGGNALQFPQLVLGMIGIFLYVGAEVAIGSFLINFMAHEDIMGWPEDVASIYLSYYWGGLMIGRLCGAIAMTQMANPAKKPIYIVLTAAGLIALIYFVTAIRHEGNVFTMEFMPFAELLPFIGLVVLCLGTLAVGKGKPALTLAIFCATLILLLVVTALASGKIALWAALGIGLFNSIMWSNIFTLAIDDLGEHTSQGSSLLVMMIVGGAIFPLIMGATADFVGVRAAFLVPIVSYIYIGFYGWWSQRRIAAKQVVT